MIIERIITQEARTILERLSFLPDIHIVGGYVRDLMQGLHPSDIDLATSAAPELVKTLCRIQKIKVVATGIDHGTVTLLIGDDKYELTTFRSDFNCDGRHADVKYVSTIKEDLNRRDFTINAMAIDGNFMLIDPYDGLGDIERKILKCVGNPLFRFTEDKLRIIRACRFAARYGYAFDKETWDCMVALAAQVFQFVSVERFVMEMTKVFKAVSLPSHFLSTMYELDILQDYIPDFRGFDKLGQNPQYHPEGDVWTHIKMVVDKSKGIEARWIALFHDIGKGETYQRIPGETYYSYKGHADIGARMIPRIGKKLKLPNYLIHTITECTRYHMRAYHLMPYMKKNKIRAFQHDVTAEYLPVLKELCIADAHDRKDIDLGIFDPMPLKVVFKPVVGGEMIMKFFAKSPPYDKPGPAIGRLRKIGMTFQLETGITDVDTILNRLTDEVYPDLIEELNEKEDQYNEM